MGKLILPTKIEMIIKSDNVKIAKRVINDTTIDEIYKRALK